ncbi:12378_t:CDS:2, partial [Gigaspora margarita]
MPEVVSTVPGIRDIVEGTDSYWVVLSIVLVVISEKALSDLNVGVLGCIVLIGLAIGGL